MPLALDRGVRLLAGGRVLLGESRMVRLRDAATLEQALSGRAPRLARQLLDAGLLHPRPGPVPDPDVVVVVPVRDRAAELDRCLTALGRAVPVLVVDDGSDAPDEVAQVAARHGAEVLHLPVNVGPAAAREAGAAATRSRLVAFVDSDCVPGPGWLEALAGHLDDDRVAAVAPRVRSRPGRTLLARYARARGPLDLGPREAPVRPGGRVSYVPSAVLLLRRDALVQHPFEPALRYGEDVDLVWRLHDAGWSVRYDPRTVVLHQEPEQWGAWLRRRHAYGTSAAPLAARHPGRLAPLVLPVWPGAAWLLLLAGRPLPAVAAAAVPAARLARTLRRAEVPATRAGLEAARTVGRGVLSTGAGLGGGGAVVALPLLLTALVPRSTRRAALAALLLPPLLEHARRRPRLDLVRWTALRLLDDAAYASGVWRGCWTARSTAALRPRRNPAG